MIPVTRDEISTHPVRADFTLRLHGEIKFPPDSGLDLYTFSFNFPL